jgi:hypothetical protein
MVKPVGSESHIHSINNFVSDNVIVGGDDMVITGIGNIYSDGALKFKQVPITVHLMEKQHVLGLIIDTVKTENHFASTHEMFGDISKWHWIGEDRKNTGNADKVTTCRAAKQKKYEYAYEYGINSL